MIRYLTFFFLALGTLQAQDRIYFTEGNSIEGKVVEVGINDITIKIDSLAKNGLLQKHQKSGVLLIAYSNGRIEVYNRPEKDLIHDANKTPAQAVLKSPEILNTQNLVYFNTLALCNADISVFYERLVRNKKYGIGIMAAYNFNIQAGLLNVFIFDLNNPKKNYDLGAFVNFYPSRFKKRNTISYGAFIKYMNFSFSSVNEVNPTAGSVVVYTPSKGHQLATMFSFSLQTYISDNFFFRYTAALGGFFLHGEYKEQYNYIYNSTSPPSEEITISFLPKGYLGFSIGHKF